MPSFNIMKFTNVLMATLLGLLGFAIALPASTSSIKRWDLNYPKPPAGALYGVIENWCPFDIYVQHTVAASPGYDHSLTCVNTGDVGPFRVVPKHAYVGIPKPVWKDSCGHSLKVSRYPGGPVYQFEMNWAQENDLTWYNLSNLDGNPFIDYSRMITGPEWRCPVLRCEAGDNSKDCNYPKQTQCGVIDEYVLGRVCFEWSMVGSDTEAPQLPVASLE